MPLVKGSGIIAFRAHALRPDFGVNAGGRKDVKKISGEVQWSGNQPPWNSRDDLVSVVVLFTINVYMRPR